MYTPLWGSINSSIENILKSQLDHPRFTLDDILQDNVLDTESKNLIVKFCKDKTIIFNVTYEQLLCAVWQKIMLNKESGDTLKIILCSELQDSKTGSSIMCKLARLVNCLAGFYDDILISY